MIRSKRWDTTALVKALHLPDLSLIIFFVSSCRRLGLFQKIVRVAEKFAIEKRMKQLIFHNKCFTVSNQIQWC